MPGFAASRSSSFGCRINFLTIRLHRIAKATIIDMLVSKYPAAFQCNGRRVRIDAERSRALAFLAGLIERFLAPPAPKSDPRSLSQRPKASEARVNRTEWQGL